MTNRRQFVQAGAAIGAAVASGAPALAAGKPAVRASALPLHRVAFDSRYPASLAFGAEARRLGAVVHDTGGDATGLYVGELLEPWRTRPVPVAGMTPYQQLFVLRMMAEGAGLRLIYVGHHGRDDHAMFGSQAVVAGAADRLASAPAWSAEVARTVMAWPAAEATVARARSNIAAADDRGVGHDTLVSWILAPVQRA